MNDIQGARKLIVHAVMARGPMTMESTYWTHPYQAFRQSASMVCEWFLISNDGRDSIRAQSEMGSFPMERQNSFAARRVAASELPEHLLTWFKREPDAEHPPPFGHGG